jgi:hypothetical protein
MYIYVCICIYIIYIHTSIPINTGMNSDETDDKDAPIPSKHVEHSTQHEQDEASKHKALQQKGCIPPNDNMIDDYK